jgi:hypothetical protein
MFKFITILIAAIPVFLFLRTVLRRSTVMKQAASDFRRRIDYLVWVMLLIIGVGVVYSVANLLHPAWR